MPGKEKENNPLLIRIVQRNTRFHMRRVEREAEEARTAREDLKLFDKVYDGPCTVTFADQAPFAVFNGEVWETGMRKEAYARGLHRTDGSLRKLTDREIISFWEKFYFSLPSLQPGFQLKGFQEPSSFRKKK